MRHSSHRSRLGSLAVAALVAVGLLALTPTLALGAIGPVDFDDVGRLGGSDRYGTSVAIAREAYPGWTGLEHVVVASGDEGIPDALSASGLCWAYDAPLLLTSASRTPGALRTALAEIASVAPTVTVHVVGGESPVPAARLAEIAALVPGGTVERLAGSDRYRTASLVARRMNDVAQAAGGGLGRDVLLANGADDAHLVDALVCSAVTAGSGTPLLLVSSEAIPQTTQRALDDLGLDRRFVAGGPDSVARGVVVDLGAARVWGASRYGTAEAIARRALAESWATTAAVGVAAGVPDALTGAGLIGRAGGTLLLTERMNLHEATARFLDDLPASTRAYAFGGESVVSDSIVRQLAGDPAVPVLTSLPAGTDYCGSRIPLHVKTGVNAVRVKVYNGDTLVANRVVQPFTHADMGDVDAKSGTNSIRIVSVSAEGGTSQATHRVRPLGYSWNNYIVVDKGDYKLYWVHNGVLEDVYPIAHGRNWRTPEGVWRIDAKYYSDPGGVYGPRKMRLYRRLSNGVYSFSPYLIHGTNQPWVIGTQASAGCIRMYNEDVLELYPKVPLRTMVVTRP